MAFASNLIGNRYGKLVVVDRAENNHKGNTMWLCKCDCGNTKIALGYDLTHGRTVSCGCNNVGKISSRRRDATNQRFGKLVAININRSENGKVFWNCLCDCGNTTVVCASNLFNGHTQSCGCINAERIKTYKHENTIKDKVGKRYNNFIITEKIGYKNGKLLWKCRCDCGREFEVDNRKIATKLSCGCLNKNSLNNPNSDFHYFVKSGLLNEKTYYRLQREWNSMITRCKENYHNYDVYYDRGIKVCNEWLDFRVFALWAIQNGYQDDLTLDRIDNDKGYTPDNCRWATWKTQQNNRRNNVYITYSGKTQTLKQWSEELNLSYGMLKQRHRNGWMPPMLFDEKHKN